MSDSAPSARPVHLLAEAGGRLVLWLPLSVIQVGSAVRDIPPGRVRLVLPQQLRLDVGDGVLLLLLHLLLLLLRPGRVGEARRRGESLLVLLHQVIGVTPTWQTRVRAQFCFLFLCNYNNKTKTFLMQNSIKIIMKTSQH